MDPQSFFAHQVNARLGEAPDLFRWDRRVRVRLRGARERAWTLDLGAAPRCTEADTGPVDCTLTLDAGDLPRVLADPGRLKDLFLGGGVTVDGALEVAMHLPGLFTVLTAPVLPPGLEDLLAGVGAEAFHTAHWPGRPLVVHGPLARMAPVAELPALGSVQDLLAVWPMAVRLGDRAGGRLVSGAAAADLYRGGQHLAFSDADRVLPPLRGILERLRWELRLPIHCYGRCLVYASPPGTGEVLHFDQNANLVLQLRGRKRWDLAPNHHVHLPTDRYTSALPVPSAELRTYAPARLPTTLPAGAETHTLRPGSLLFLPRGHWHQTHAEEESLSLNFTFDQPTWADVVVPEIRRRLLGETHWRELAAGAGAPHRSVNAAAASRLDTLLAGLAGELATLDATAAIARLTPSEPGELPLPAAAPGAPDHEDSALE